MFTAQFTILCVQNTKIEPACPNPPCSLVLVSKQYNSNEAVVGNCRIVPVKNEEYMLYLEAGLSYYIYRVQRFSLHV